MAKLINSDDLRKSYEVLQPHITGTLFDNFFQKFSPRTAYTVFEGILYSLNLELAVTNSGMSLRRISNMWSATIALMRIFESLNTAIFLHDCDYEEISTITKDLSTFFENDGTAVVALDDLTELALIAGILNPLDIEACGCLKRIFLQLTLQEGKVDYMADLLAA